MSAPDRCEPAQRLFLAVPCYGQPSRECMLSIIAAHEAMRQAGGVVDLAVLPGCCYIDHARNQLATEFLEGGCSDILFVDADIQFDLEALTKIVMATRPVVAGIYRKKTDEAMTWPVRFGEGEHTMVDGLLEATHVPTGFLRINRAALEHLVAEGHAPRYGNGHGGRKWRRFFRCNYEQDPLGEPGDLEYWGEDYQFSRDCTAAGLKLWTIPDMTLGHCGEKVYVGNWAEWMVSQGAAKRKEAA